jgi:hypothetical protein
MLILLYIIILDRFSSPRPEGPVPGEPGAHTESVDNRGLFVLVVKEGKRKEGRRERLSTFHFNFNAFLISNRMMDNDNVCMM